MKSNDSSTRETGNRALPKPDCVVKVGEGRGFVFGYRVRNPPSMLRRLRKLQTRKFRPHKFIWPRVVVTAAHCLGNLPPAHGMAFFWERTYNLLGTLDGSKKDICAECLFVDPVADIAVLGCPDEKAMGQQADAYHEVVDEASAVRIGKPRNGRAWVLTLDGHWTSTPMKVLSGLYGTSLSIGPTSPGMSGSPILNDAGRAVGLVALGGETINSKGERQQIEMQGPQPILSRDLPARFIG